MGLLLMRKMQVMKILKITPIETDVPFETLMRGEFNLIYSHPEALFKTRFAKLLRSKLYQDTVCAVVIDEVHMISEW